MLAQKTTGLDLSIIETLRQRRQVGPAISAPLVIHELGGECAYLNPAFFRRFGYSLHDLQTRSFETLWGASIRLAKETETVLIKSGKPQLFAHRFIDPVGRLPSVIHHIDWLIQDGPRRYRVTLAVDVQADAALPVSSAFNP